MTLVDKLKNIVKPGEKPIKKSNLGLHSQDRIYWVPSTNPNSELILQRTQGALRNHK
ncbi:MAG: hypothetical protein US62_C0002G0021 [Candidatus Woesebacteria bacterium GW2011_GWA1_37_8]|uniref:Uncharacterized protein n=2 Tax=Candidatus Woeseibacteriota TaxID=1752722 RepID=A0A0G0PDX9_9BACT|nr:MAG: hypothetical protein US39_C0009G0019 [Microgenomates group bacterium GW2011_GWC1_37_12b]KKQ46338.1 MAG: hypothetical protein US62_C0002G0021 [Candidatus Woesebacteria bacterium GW2011_GWA1_37_8]KKQ87496.1 MAG: hypothetical protein UT10_C0005G0019 [Candidatus Woesebacteria bacterium GW2011_GWB1_38_8b]